MKRVTIQLFALVALAFTACQKDQIVPGPGENKVLINSDFSAGTDGWTGDFTDYDVQQESIMDFSFRHEALPAPLNTSEKALKISGSNRSDDMFMFVKRKVTGLKANTEYRLQFDLEIASQYADNSVGIGGSPALAVYLKAGASATEPVKVKKGTYYDISIDKGNQSSGGKDAMLLGHVGAGDDVNQYKLIQRSNKEQPFTAKTNDKGELWVIIGTDSGFEGITTLYYNKIKVTAL
ncbi:hypothetical protein GCM10023189_49170 [Nibrella saemangeumensis]|uniref:Lipoprotein n=1 Tax=Nibrella saemangeumensis TaxID=1084526 RepID=A0ABP8NJP7_9BACT